MLFFVLLISMLSPALVLLLTFKTNVIRKSSIVPAFMVGFSMAFVFYGYIPDQGADILRHIMWLESYRNIPLWKCFDAGHYTLTYTWDIWSWLIAQTNNDNLLQVSGAFVGYTISSYMVFDTFRCADGKSKKHIFLAFFVMICLLPPHGFAVGIRNSNAFLICGFGFYLFYRKRIGYIGTVVLLLLGVFLHHSASIAVILWLLFPVYKRNKKIATVAFFVGSLSFELVYTRFLAPILVSRSGGIGALFESVVESAYIAYEGRDLFKYVSLNSTVNKWAGIILVAFIILKNSISLKESDEDSSFYGDMVELSSISFFFFIIALGLSITFALNGERFIYLSGFIALVPLSYSFARGGKLFEGRKNVIVDSGLMLASVAVLLLHMYSLDYGTGSLASLLMDGLIGIIWPMINGT